MRELEQKIAHLEAQRELLGDAAVDAAIAALRGEAVEPSTTQQQQAGGNIVASPQSSDTINATQSQGFINHPTGSVEQTYVNLNTIQNFFGTTTPAEDQTSLLSDYLDSLANECQQLRLSRLTGRQQTGNEQQTTPPLRLQAIYTSLTTNGTPVVVHYREYPAARMKRLMQRLRSRDAADVSPVQVREIDVDFFSPPDDAFYTRLGKQPGESLTFDDVPDDTLLCLTISRPELTTEAISHSPRLVLLGEPGSGKSTVLRYLALLLAQKALNPSVELPGWLPDHLPVPLLCPLGTVASALTTSAGDADEALWQAIEEVLDGTQGIRAGLRDHLRPALRKGGVLLLFDGLDELPMSGNNPRIQIAQALRRFAAEVPHTPIVVTCRILPYQADGDWKLPEDEGWNVRTIQPLAFGQIQQFVRQWYTELAEKDPAFDSKEAQQRSETLITALRGHARLQPLIRSPLLLTMLAILHGNRNEIPDDRVMLYEECVELLLERWEPARTPGIQHEGLIQRLAIPNLQLAQIREELHKLALQAHAQPPGDDGRGLLNRYELSGRMTEFFRRLRSADPLAHVQTFLDALNEESGLLVARGDNAYTFPHLTFQEYLAACGLADRAEMVQSAYGYWTGEDASRWREVLLLFVGRLRQRGSLAVEQYAVAWLERLVAQKVGRRTKSSRQRWWDVALAALSYHELGGQTTLATTQVDVEAKIEQPLRYAIVDLLTTPDSGVVATDRIATADVLATLTDPRFPVTMDEWHVASVGPHAAAHQSAILDLRSLHRYWCYVRSGAYHIGGWERGQKSDYITLKHFWIARYPITVAQYAPFIAAGGYETEQWWTPHGWQWKQKEERTEPYWWYDTSFNGSNQPVVGMTWYEAVAFTRWLTAHLYNTLPNGYAIRLPTEVEWEAAAAYDVAMQRRTYPWGEDEPTPERAIYDESNIGRPAPVGCCAAGAAACGAMDMVGNVWEWTVSSYKAYPAQSGPPDAAQDFSSSDVNLALRGGSWWNGRTNVRCRARDGIPPGYWLDFNNLGFRLVVAPRLPQS